MLLHNSNTNTWETEAGGLKIQAIQGYTVKPSFNHSPQKKFENSLFTF
jgi:hypothetical protein